LQLKASIYKCTACVMSGWIFVPFHIWNMVWNYFSPVRQPG
jgi:hypothetical protein